MDPTQSATTRTGTLARSEAAVSAAHRPRLARHVRLTFCRTRQRHVLLHPETVVVLNRTGADILALCDGSRSVAEIVAELGARYRTAVDDDTAVDGSAVDEEVRRFLARLVDRRWVELGRE